MYDKKRYHEVRLALITLFGGKCWQCPSTNDLQFDHKDAALKVFTVSSVWSRRRLREMLLEVSKCQLLCKSCHKKKSATEASARMKSKYRDVNGPDGYRHGTTYGWMKKKCGCTLCSERKRAFYETRNTKRRTQGTQGRMPYKKAEHGSSGMYSYHGCRCDKCKAAHAKSQREWRKNHKIV